MSFHGSTASGWGHCKCKNGVVSECSRVVDGDSYLETVIACETCIKTSQSL